MGELLLESEACRVTFTDHEFCIGSLVPSPGYDPVSRTAHLTDLNFRVLI